MKRDFLGKARVIVLIVVLQLISFNAYGQSDKLIVRDPDNNTVFSVMDTGNVFAGGTDANNAFQLKVMGHVGGTSHVQLTTDQTNSRITLIGSASNDYAPRFQAVGPEDPQNPGWVLFDYGSHLFNLSSAAFKIRHYNAAGVVDMVSITGRNTVSFPNGNVGIGTTTPSHLLELKGGAYSDGYGWYPASSREYKENVRALGTEEAMNTLEGLNPVRYNYKGDNEQGHVGFIAEDVPDLVALKDRKALSPMDIVAVLTKVVQEQQKTIDRLNEKVAELDREVKLKNSFAIIDIEAVNNK